MERLGPHHARHLLHYFCSKNGHVGFVRFRDQQPIPRHRWLFLRPYLTLREFGHVRETTKQTGPIQIAFFHILSDIATIFWQFIATILAYSIAMTKAYVAEKSFISDNKGKEL